ncbi:hypothetical protein D3C85_1635890 [compost metagenome]
MEAGIGTAPALYHDFRWWDRAELFANQGASSIEYAVGLRASACGERIPGAGDDFVLPLDSGCAN